ncbi:FAD binding domain-containing protein [Colletotrichum incanum]|nr:FAD binding domain-containing protein [Colletotrichum incanum]
MWATLSNDTRLLDPAYVCGSDGHLALVVNATTPEYIKSSVDFARKNNVRLIIESTGHSHLDRSIAPDSLSTWVHHMQGAAMHKLFKAAAEHGQVVVGVTANSVSVGGCVTGGGPSLYAPRFRLAVDNVLQIEVVTPLGEVPTLN